MKGGLAMDNGFMKSIRDRVLASEDGSVFTSSDFADIADTGTIRQSLNRLVQEKILRRIIRGVFEKPKYSKLLEEYVAVSPDAVAQALARSYHWTIAPCGDTALNLLGLSDQVTAVWSYISDGPYKTYEWNHVKIEFRHRTNREITGLSYMTSLVIHGLKALGKERVSEETIERLSARLSEPEKTALLRESSESSDWIVDTVRKICLGGAA
jgi:hypothetical protein